MTVLPVIVYNGYPIDRKFAVSICLNHVLDTIRLMINLHHDSVSNFRNFYCMHKLIIIKRNITICEMFVKILFKFDSIILSSRSVNSQNARYNRALKFKTRSKIAAFTLKTVRVKRKKTSSSLSDRMEEPDLTKISLLLQIAREAKSPTRQNLDSRYHPSLQSPPCQHEKIINRDKREAKKKPQGGGSGEIIGVFTQRPRVGLGGSNRSRCSLFISSFFSSASLTLRRGQQAVSSAASLDTEVWMNARNN